MTKILVIDDEKNVHYSFKRVFKDLEIISALNAGEGLEILDSDVGISLIISDIKMPGMSGLDLLTELKSRGVKIPVIIITAHGTLENAINAVKNGATDYLIKPFDFKKLKEAVYNSLNIEIHSGEKKIPEKKEGGEQAFLIGNSALMQDVYREIAKVALKDVTVLITGESGTGKELVAKAVHYYSHRKDGPFVAVNCGAIPSELIESELFGYEKGAFTGAYKKTAGKFQLASGGTLFLDEIGELPLHLQVKILRVLQESEVVPLGSSSPVNIDVRIVAATNKNLKDESKDGNFREDLFYRLNVIGINLPPLKDRKEDIPSLVEHFVKNINRQYSLEINGLDKKASQKLLMYDFPGNVRELENVITRASINASGNVIELKDIELDFSEEIFHSKLEKNLENIIKMLMERNIKAFPYVEKIMLSTLLKINDYNQSKTADYLGINRNTLRKKLQEHKIL